MEDGGRGHGDRKQGRGGGLPTRGWVDRLNIDRMPPGREGRREDSIIRLVRCSSPYSIACPRNRKPFRGHLPSAFPSLGLFSSGMNPWVPSLLLCTILLLVSRRANFKRSSGVGGGSSPQLKLESHRRGGRLPSLIPRPLHIYNLPREKHSSLYKDTLKSSRQGGFSLASSLSGWPRGFVLPATKSL